MPFTETEIVEVRLWYGKCAYGERNDINTDYLLKFLGTEATWVEGQIVSFAAVIRVEKRSVTTLVRLITAAKETRGRVLVF